ncbi:MAG: hypothetical protein RL346_24 [Verrucomicrobiota bacterium]|jgi:hypothetical protein
MIKSAIQLFGIMLGASLLSAVLGGLFAMFIAWVSPEFVGNLFSSADKESLVRYSFSVGMIWGLFIGAGVSGFACGLSVLMRILNLWIKVDKG